MSNIPPEVFSFLTGMGLPGLIIWYLLSQLKNSEEKREAERARYDVALQSSFEKRMDESRESFRILSASTAAIDALKSLIIDRKNA